MGTVDSTDTVVAYKRDKLEAMLDLIKQPDKLDNPTDIVFDYHGFYRRSQTVAVGRLQDPSNSPKTSLIRSFGMLNIPQLNRELDAADGQP